jgi:hypothetical protein
VDVRRVVLGCAARPDRSHDSALPDDVTLLHRDRAEVDERHRMAAGRLHRHDLSVRADGAGECDDARAGSKNVLLTLARHVDPSVLAARVRVAAVDEGLEHLPRGRPCPRVSRGRKSKRREDGDYSQTAHRFLLVGVIDNSSTVARAADVVNFAYIRVSVCRACRAGSTSTAIRDWRHRAERARRRRAPRRQLRPHRPARRTPGRRPERRQA